MANVATSDAKNNPFTHHFAVWNSQKGNGSALDETHPQLYKLDRWVISFFVIIYDESPMANVAAPDAKNTMVH